MINKTPLYLLLAMAMLLSSVTSLTSCKKDKEDDEVYSYSTSTHTTLIKGFALQADADVLANLDSVYFTIDYDNGLIYNADSLPVGTSITGLKVTVEFLNTVSSAVFHITGATQQADTTINYTSSMSQKIDFTGKTILKVTSSDGQQVKDYEVKVLVHKVNPDSLVWPTAWRRDLPGYRGSAIGHKAVMQQENLYRIMTYNGSECVLWTAAAPNQASWEKVTVELPFAPQVQSLTAAAGTLYILDSAGALYCSTDGVQWTPCGVTWHSLLGAYDDRVLGIVKGEEDYYHDEYPRPQDFESTVVESGFPVAHASNMIETDNKWTISQQAIIVGGIDSEGHLLSDVWGYDGSAWGQINNVHSSALPALADATLFPYYTYRALPGVRRYARQPAWYVMGGKLADGSLNGTIYLSTTQGVTWTKGNTAIVQPGHMAKFYGAQAFVNTETITATAANYLPRRVKAVIDSWECPYIYLFGGYNDQGKLLPNVWRGVYTRMTNYPVY